MNIALIYNQVSEPITDSLSCVTIKMIIFPLSVYIIYMLVDSFIYYL